MIQTRFDILFRLQTFVSYVKACKEKSGPLLYPYLSGGFQLNCLCVCHPSVNPQPTTGLRPQKLNFVVCGCEPLHTTKFHTKGLTLWDFGKWVGALPALVGNNRMYRGVGMLVSFYLPGTSLAQPPTPRE